MTGGREIELHRTNEAVHIDCDFDKHIEAWDGGSVDGDEAAVAVVNEEVSLKGGGGEVVNAAGPVGDVPKDEALVDAGERGEDIREMEGVHEETFGKLEGDTLGSRGEDPPDAFVDLEVVVGREKRNGGVESGIVEDRVRDLVLHETFRPRRR